MAKAHNKKTQSSGKSYFFFFIPFWGAKKEVEKKNKNALSRLVERGSLRRSGGAV